MQPRNWIPLLGYGTLAAALLASLWLVSLAPMRSQWGRELTGAAIAIVAMAVGIGLARRPSAHVPRRVDDPPVQSGDADAVPSASTPARDATSSAAEFPALSLRELEVLRLLARGLSNKEMARTLSISENTVKTHLANLYAKLGARRRTEALAAARRLGLGETA